jgi:hypothetical protein
MLFGNWVSTELGDSKKRMKISQSEKEVSNGIHLIAIFDKFSLCSVEEGIVGTAFIKTFDSREAVATDGY